MKFTKQFLVLLLVIVSVSAAGLFVSGCLSDHDDHGDHDHDHGDSNASYEALDNGSMNQVLNGSKLLVAVSVIPQAEFTEKVGGDKVIAISMIPAGAGHHYDPSPRQLEDLSQADLYFQLGSSEPFETAHMGTFIQLNPNMTVINSSEGIALILNGQSTDPHIWTSPKCAMIMVENIYEGLTAADPSNASYYRKNADAYLAELKELDAELTASLSGLRSTDFMVYHPAWGYFARDYGLEQIAVESDGKEPSPQTIVKYIELAKANNVSVIFVQEQISVSGATAIAEGFGGKVYVIDPLAKNYVQNTRAVGKALAAEMS